MMTTATKPKPEIRQTPLNDVIKQDKKVREEKSEKQIDKTIEDSFPASDPPGHF